MSGSSPGDPPDDPDERADPSSDRQDPTPIAGRNATGDTSNTVEPTSDGDRVTIEDDGVVRWFLKSDDGNVVFARDILSSVAIVAVIGLLLFAVSGIWPPLVAVESGSMEPNMEKGDLIFVIDQDRFVGDDPAGDTGVVPLENGQENDYERFGGAGDVIIYQPNGDDRQTPIIHRAHFWVEEDENWVDTKADEAIVGDATCDDFPDTCPADHDGFITKGDANNGYDQQYNDFNQPQSDVVKPEWITGKARFGIPWLGHVRLTFDSIFGGVLAPSPVLDGSSAAVGAGGQLVGPTVAGATGLAGTSAGVVLAIGRYRN